jgi:hypothetical protein
MQLRILPVAGALAALIASGLFAAPAEAQSQRGGFKPGAIAGHTRSQNPYANPRSMAPLRGPMTYDQGKPLPRAGIDATVRNPVSGTQQAAVGHRFGVDRAVNTPRANPLQQPVQNQPLVQQPVQNRPLVQQPEQQPATTGALRRGELLQRAEADSATCRRQYEGEIDRIEAEHRAGGIACFHPENGQCHDANNAKKGTALQAANAQLFRCNQQVQAARQGAGGAQAQAGTTRGR